MGPTAFRALRLLADGRFHSGEDIARSLGRSRAAISEALRGARDAGVEVHSVPGRGYRLPYPVDFLDGAAINGRLASHGYRTRVTVLEETDSTSTRLASLGASGAASGVAVAAEWQRAGRGRRGRSWQAAPGEGLTFSMLWRFDRGAGHLAGLSLAVAVAVAQALESCGCAGVGLKWPNDLVHDWAKLGGILVETSGEMQGPTTAIVGVGLNYRLSEDTAGRIGQSVTSLSALGNPLASRNTLLAALLEHLERALARFEREGFAAFRDLWRARHAYAGQRVAIEEGGKPPRTGRVLDVADNGALLVDFGSVTTALTSADLSVRPVAASA